MESDKQKTIKECGRTKIKKILVIVILTVGIFSWIYVFFDVYQIRNHRLSFQNYLSRYHRAPVSISNISSWMTFDYINKIFKLSPTYLSQTLKITDSKYPLLTIGQYSKKINASSTFLIKNIQNAIEIYSASSTPVK